MRAKSMALLDSGRRCLGDSKYAADVDSYVDNSEPPSPFQMFCCLE
ncbi:hypothetical protein M8C21_006399 [Ambrosia artemisiifolia]|uniref:Uncharacterized protein n=1 Tax=Ambrosia artemisiifolia TaxID=4212 RepID=A0AAD5GRH6_AMBAR|nr:hypothetical protein M8C21_006399 [Ambrosia artemisiifolia]